MYSGGFYPYDTLEEYWAYWSRYIYINRYQDAPKPVYQKLLSLMKNKSYFVITTNVDHCFQKAGFDKNRLFTRREITACFSALSRAARKSMTMKKSFERCCLPRGIRSWKTEALFRRRTET